MSHEEITKNHILDYFLRNSTCHLSLYSHTRTSLVSCHQMTTHLLLKNMDN